MKSFNPFDLDVQLTELGTVANGSYPITYECTTEPQDCGVDPN